MAQDGSEGGVTLPEGAALIIIDVQKGLDEQDYWGERNNPDAEQNMARLLDAWRQCGWAIYHIQHQSKNPTLAPAAGLPGERDQRYREAPAG